MRHQCRSTCDTTLLSLEDDHCQVRVWPPAPGLSILQRLETAPILPLWTVRPAQNNEELEQDSEPVSRRERPSRLRTVICCGTKPAREAASKLPQLPATKA